MEGHKRAALLEYDLEEEEAMTRPMSKSSRRQAILDLAGAMVDELEEWYDAHPEATFGEIEAKARELRRGFMGKALAVLINGRDRGLQAQRPRCPQCGAEMKFAGYRDWEIHGLEGDTTLERAYYVCPKCPGETLFPPGP
jgi:ribosomal protein S27AE